MKAEEKLPAFSLIFLLLSLSSADFASDSRRLLSFKTSLSDPDQLPGWLPTVPPCNFTGVSCIHSRVSSINLSSIPLRANFSTLAHLLLSLPNLHSLILKNANISGPISQFTCAASFRSLDLAGNAISGTISDLSTLTLCPSLISLNLSGNSIADDQQPAVSAPGLPSLQFLDLSHNKISRETAISWILSNEFPELHHLSLKANNFSTKFPVLSDCSSLEHLDLSSNKFYGDVETSFLACPKLRFLNLTDNQLTGAPPNPAPTLQFLFLKQNHFHGVF